MDSAPFSFRPPPLRQPLSPSREAPLPPHLSNLAHELGHILYFSDRATDFALVKRMMTLHPAIRVHLLNNEDGYIRNRARNIDLLIDSQVNVEMNRRRRRSENAVGQGFGRRRKKGRR